MCLSVCYGTSLFSSNPLLGTVDILSLLTALIVQRKSCPLAWTHGFAIIGLVKSVLNLPEGQVKYCGRIQVTEVL